MEAFLVDPTLDTPAADTNFDGQIDLADFDTLKDNFATGEYDDPAFRSQGNFNGDAVLDIKDFALLKAEFCQEMNPVPEPGTWWLFSAGMPQSLLGWRRRRPSKKLGMPARISARSGAI